MPHACFDVVPSLDGDKRRAGPSTAPVPPTVRVSTMLPCLVVCGVVASGVLHGMLQEQVQQLLSGRMPLTVTAYEFGVCSSLSAIVVMLRDAGAPSAPPKRRPHFLQLLRISVLVCASIVSGNLALRWVSFPVKVIIKSCKLLPTMCISGLLLRKRYSRLDHIAAALLCASIVGLTLAERPPEATAEAGTEAEHALSSPIGVCLLLFAVSCDAVQVLLSERLLRDHAELTPHHVMLHTNGLAFIATLAGLLLTGELEMAPAALPWRALILCGLTSWVGVYCFISLTRAWGGAAAVVTTSVRKILTVALSFMLFPKPFGATSAAAVGVAVAGLGLHAYGKVQRERAKAHVD